MTDRQKQIIDAMKKNPDKSQRAIAAMMGASKSAVTRAAVAMKKEQTCDNIETNWQDTEGTVTTRSANIKTIDDALAAASVDMAVWRVKRHTVNTWEVTMGGDKTASGRPETFTNYQVKVWFERIVPSLSEQIIKELISRAPHKVCKPDKKATGSHAVLLSLYDVHFGKLAWADETGSDYDCKIARRVYVNAVHDLLEDIKGFSVDTIYLPIGQDFFNINGADFSTSHGTPQDVDGRLPKIFALGCEAVIDAIEHARKRCNVEVIWVPGNHDAETSYYLAKYLEAWFRDDSRVSVDASPPWRKYRHYGNNLIGMTHGNEEPHRDLPTIMAGEMPQEWAGSDHREWFVGHLHKKKETRYSAGDTFGAVGVRIIPSLSGTDAWHYRKGYVKGTKAAEAHIFSRDIGYRGHFTVQAR